jgi:hypothetical protein
VVVVEDVTVAVLVVRGRGLGRTCVGARPVGVG